MNHVARSVKKKRGPVAVVA